MALALEFHPEADAELTEAVDWYDAERRGLGAAFLVAVREAVERARRAPLTGTPAGNDLRRVFVNRFPYAVLYAVDAQRVYVVAVAHFRRRPGYWKHRQG